MNKILTYTVGSIALVESLVIIWVYWKKRVEKKETEPTEKEIKIIEKKDF